MRHKIEIGFMKFWVVCFLLLFEGVAIHAQEYDFLFETMDFSWMKSFNTAHEKRKLAMLDHYIHGAIDNVHSLNQNEFNKGMSLMSTHELDSAIGYFTRIVNREKYGLYEGYLTDLSYLNLGICYFQKHELKTSFSFLKKCPDNEIEQLSLRSIKAIVYYSAHKYKKAEKLSLKAMALV